MTTENKASGEIKALRPFLNHKSTQDIRNPTVDGRRNGVVVIQPTSPQSAGQSTIGLLRFLLVDLRIRELLANPKNLDDIRR